MENSICLKTAKKNVTDYCRFHVPLVPRIVVPGGHKRTSRTKTYIKALNMLILETSKIARELIFYQRKVNQCIKLPGLEPKSIDSVFYL